MMKKLASILLAILMVALLSSAAMALEGAGTSESPYLIGTAAELAEYRDLVNSGETDACAKLTDNITLSGEWTPIGNGTRASSSYSGNAFTGVFDGNHKTISGLQMTTTLSNEELAMGLFGVVNGGTVKNVTLSNVSINISNGNNVGAAVGVLVGDGLVSGVTVSGSVKAEDGVGGVVGRMMVSGTIENCSNSANVEISGNGGAGGIVGKAYYTKTGKEMNILSCSNSGSVYSPYAAGGIAGLSASNVMQCDNSGTITAGTEAGGIVGEQVNYGEISFNENTGDVKNNGSGGTAYGGIIGWVRYQDNASYTNNEVIVVTGNVNTKSINAPDATLGTGGIVGHAYNQITATGNTNTAASIKGGVFAAGIVGGLQNESSNRKITNSPKQFVVTNNISKTASANITANCTHAYAYINDPAASYVIENNGDGEFVAVVGGKYFMALQAAVNAANGNTVKLLQNIELTETVTIASGKTVTLDLNGKTVSMKHTTDITANHCMISNNGNLTIDDSASGGKLTYQYTGANTWTGSNGNATNTITNRPGSTLTVLDGTIENKTSSNHIRYAIDSQTNGNGGDITVNVRGGKIINDGSIAIRAFLNSTTNTNMVNITGGTLNGGVQLHDSNANANKGVANITSGTINSTTSYAVYLYGNGDASNVKLNISGGVFNGQKDNAAVYLTCVNTTKVYDATVTGGTFNGYFWSNTWKTGVATDVKTVSGGTFSNEVAEGYIVEGYKCIPYGNVYRIGKAYDVTFTPSDATIVVKDSDGYQMEANNGVYTLLPGDYTYTANKTGYREATGSFSVTDANRSVEVTLPTIDANAPSIIDDTLISATYVQDETAKALSVTAQPNGDGVLSYQWYVVSSNGIPTMIDGATENTYVPKTNEVGTKSYFCVVTNTYASATGEKTASVESEEADITVTAKAGEHVAHIVVNGRENKSYKTVTAYMVELGSTAKLNEKTLEQISTEGNFMKFSYSQAAKDGKYNMVITATLADGKDTQVTTTTLIDLEGHDDDHDVTLPDDLRSSTVEDKTNTGIIVGGVEEVAEKVDEIAKKLGVEIDKGEHVEVELKIEEEKKVASEDKDAIAEMAAEGGATVEQIVNIDLLLKKINNNGQQTGETYDLGGENDQLLKILIPFQLGDRKPENVVMLRMHDDEVQTLRQIPATSNKVTDECFIVYNDHIELHAKKFSAYAIAYNKGDAAVISDPTEAKTVSVLVGDTATMTVTAQNAKRYQWQINRNDGEGWIDCGENKPVYITSATTLDNNGYQYKCIVTGTNDKAVESPIFTLEVISSVSLPTTGDNSNMALWLAMLGMSMLVLCGAALKRRVN